MTKTSLYVGRFAPSPTGPLHIGSLIGALASFLDAKANNGKWRVRIEDIDPPREIEGATQSILKSLDAHGLTYDGAVLYQSQRQRAYRTVLQQLMTQQKTFYCTCSRSDLNINHGIYNGQCRNRNTLPNHEYAMRLQVDNQPISFIDPIQGLFSQQLESEIGDFVLKRKDGYFSYQLAVVIDDAYQKITHVVRGSDLLDSTPRQIYLQHQLAYPQPRYVHIPVITHNEGQKLSKQTGAPALDNTQAYENLLFALNFLQQRPPPPSMNKTVENILAWAIENWQIENIPKTTAINTNFS